MNKVKNFWKDTAVPFFKRHKKRILFIGIPIVIVLLLVLRAQKIDPNDFTTFVVKNENLVSTVRSTGQVTSVTDLSLGFRSSGVVRSVMVKVGDVVRKGTILATLDNQDELGSLLQAQAAQKLAEANYQKTLEGATSEELQVSLTSLNNAKIDLESTKKQQSVLVENARRTLLSSDLVATPTTTTTQSIQNPVISGTYTKDVEGSYKLSVYQTGAGSYYNVSGLSSYSGAFSSSAPSPLGVDGLFVQAPVGFVLGSNTVWTIDVPNKQSSSYVTNYNLYQNALANQTATTQSAQALVDQKNAEYNLKKAQARPADLDAKEAEVLSAKGRVQSAGAMYEDTIIRAPADGTITKVDIKVGEVAEVQKEVITLQDVGNLYIEASVNESNITNITTGQNVTLTIDAFGPEKTFSGIVTQVDPGATVQDGIVNYIVKISIQEREESIKPGMNANVTIVTGNKENVLVLPESGIFEKEGALYVHLLTDEDKYTYEDVIVTTGQKGDGNLVEILSGLTVDQKVVVLNKK